MGRGCACAGNGAWHPALVLGGWRLLSVLGIATGAAVVFLVVLTGLTILPLIEFLLPSRTAADSAKTAKTQSRWRSLLVPVGALIITVTLVGMGLAVDRFYPSYPADGSDVSDGCR